MHVYLFFFLPAKLKGVMFSRVFPYLFVYLLVCLFVCVCPEDMSIYYLTYFNDSLGVSWGKI